MFVLVLHSTDSEAYQYAYNTPMRQTSGYSEVSIDPTAPEEQPTVYENYDSVDAIVQHAEKLIKPMVSEMLLSSFSQNRATV